MIKHEEIPGEDGSDSKICKVIVGGNNDGDVFSNRVEFRDTDDISGLMLEEFHYNYNKYNPNGCFCFNWPYFCGLTLTMDSVMIINAFDPKRYHCVAIPTSASFINVVQMIITNSQDLIIGTFEQVYNEQEDKTESLNRLYKMNLDTSNTMEWESLDNHEDFFKVELLKSYSCSAVDN